MKITIPYKPRPLQKLLHKSLEKSRFNVLVCHRRFGKTVMEINRLIKASLTCTHVEPRYAYLAPTYAQGKAVAWDYLRRYSRPIPGVQINETELRVDYPNKSRIRIFGADNPDSLRGLGLDGVVFDEYEMMSPRVWSEIVRPALADREGWADFIGTPKGNNQFKEVLDYGKLNDWFTVIYKASETNIIPAEELAALQSVMSEEEYAQEMECSFDAAIKGSYYGKVIANAEKDNRITSVPYVSTLPVYTFWDLGMRDSTAMWFVQVVGNEYHVIDYFEASGEGLNYYVKTLKEKPYIYASHHLPHDVEVRELGTGHSRREVLEQLGLPVEVVPNLPIEDGIEAVRAVFNRCWFDQERCKVGLDALKSYHKEWDDKMKVYRSQPKHDWSEHGASAFRYFAVGMPEALPPTKSVTEEVYAMSFDGWNG